MPTQHNQSCPKCGIAGMKTSLVVLADSLTRSRAGTSSRCEILTQRLFNDFTPDIESSLSLSLSLSLSFFAHNAHTNSQHPPLSCPLRSPLQITITLMLHHSQNNTTTVTTIATIATTTSRLSQILRVPAIFNRLFRIVD